MDEIDRYAVFGDPIKHSKSPFIHARFAEQTGQTLTYEAQQVPAIAFEDTVRTFFNQGGKGLNCTVPLKELAWRYADRNTERANQSKAVNTLILEENGEVLGDNTDGVGLLNDLMQNHGIAINSKRILIVGAGGATRGILAPLLAQGPETIAIANRTVSKAQALAKEFSGEQNIEGCGFETLDGLQFDLIINATSASLSGDLPPLPQNLLAEKGVCYDLAYANQATAFVHWSRDQGASKSLDGLGMLVEQAAEAFYQWRGVRPETQPVIALLEAQRK